MTVDPEANPDANPDADARSVAYSLRVDRFEDRTGPPHRPRPGARDEAVRPRS
ncbi:hypothetical protein [Streptomyces sp. NPDC054854]